MIKWVKLSIILVWIILVGAAYLHLYPFATLLAGLPSVRGCNVFAGAIRLFPHFLALLFIIFAANGWGIYFWFDQHLRFNEKLAFATGAGLGAISLAVLIANFFAVAGNGLFLIMLFSGSIIFVFAMPRIYTGNHTRPSWLVALCLLPIASALVGALAAPTQFDSLCYHLALPAQYILKGRMFRIPNNFFFSFPQNAEMLFQLGLTIDSDILANLIHWSFFPLIALPLHTLTARYMGERAAWFATLIWCFTPAAMFLATGTYVDLALTFYLFLSLHAVLLWYLSRHERWLISAGIFFGLALGTKYTAGVYGIALAILLIYNTRRFRELFIFSITAGFVFLPWLIKNAVYLGNPFAPWGAALFSKSVITFSQAGKYFSHIRGHGMAINTLRDAISLPWRITAYGYSFGGAFDIFGPVFLLFIPMLLLKHKYDKLRIVLMSYSFLSFVAWAFTGQVLRFLMPIVPLMCILSAEGIVQAQGVSIPVPLKDKLRIVFGRQPQKLQAKLTKNSADQSIKQTEHAFRGSMIGEFAAKAVIYPLIAVAVTHNIIFFHWVMSSPDPYRPVLCGINRNEYLNVKLNYYGALNDYVNKLPSAKVLFLGETRSYYCRKSMIAPTYFDVNPFFAWANNAPGGDALLSSLQQEHITHILFNQTEYERLGFARQLTIKGQNAFDQLKRDHLVVEYSDKNTRVYSINPLAGAPQ